MGQLGGGYNPGSSASTVSTALKATVTAGTPDATKDSKAGYGVGSTWIDTNTNTQYYCAKADVGAAVWVNQTQMAYYSDWAAFRTALLADNSGSLVGKFATVANANGGPVGGATFNGTTATPNPTTAITDGGSADYQVAASTGAAFTIVAQARTITNPVITSVMVKAANKPTAAGYYIFNVTPSNGLPTGISLGDLAYFDGTTWSLYCKYALAPSAVLVGTSTADQRSWARLNGGWVLVTTHAFHGVVSSAQSISATSAKLTNWTAQTDTCNGYASGEWTVPTDGIYSVSAQVQLASGTFSSTGQLSLQVRLDGTLKLNGVQIVESTSVTDFYTSQVPGALIRATAGQKISLWCGVNALGAGTRNTNTDTTTTWFSIVQIV